MKPIFIFLSLLVLSLPAFAQNLLFEIDGITVDKAWRMKIQYYSDMKIIEDDFQYCDAPICSGDQYGGDFSCSGCAHYSQNIRTKQIKISSKVTFYHLDTEVYSFTRGITATVNSKNILEYNFGEGYAINGNLSYEFFVQQKARLNDGAGEFKNNFKDFAPFKGSFKGYMTFSDGRKIDATFVIH
jgi:hypothetical protein